MFCVKFFFCVEFSTFPTLPCRRLCAVLLKLMQKSDKVFRAITFLVSKEMNYDRMTWSIALNSAENSSSLFHSGCVLRARRSTLHLLVCLSCFLCISVRPFAACCKTMIWDSSTVVVPVCRRTYFQILKFFFAFFTWIGGESWNEFHSFTAIFFWHPFH